MACEEHVIFAFSTVKWSMELKVSCGNTKLNETYMHMYLFSIENSAFRSQKLILGDQEEEEENTLVSFILWVFTETCIYLKKHTYYSV